MMLGLPWGSDSSFISSEGEIWAVKKKRAPFATTRRRSKYDIDFITPTKIHLEYLLTELKGHRTPARINKAQYVVDRYVTYNHLTHRQAEIWKIKMEGDGT